MRLPNTNEKFLVIALTTRDINDRSQSLRFLFASNDKMTHTSVISVARMFASTPTVDGTQAQVGLRIYKMVKRAIGEQYFGLPRSASIADIMYAPIMSLEDIDAMGVDYKR
jgi:predicted Zn-dependent protease